LSTDSPLGRPTSQELALQFQSDPTAEVSESDVSLRTIPASSPAMRQLLRELGEAAAKEPSGSPMQSLLTRITRGEIDLRSALDDPSLPTPDADSLDESTRTLIEDLKEIEADQ